MPTLEPQPRRIPDRIWLVIAYGVFTVYSAGQFIALITAPGDPIFGEVTREALFVHMSLFTLYGILATLPMLMVIGYQRSQLATLKAKIKEDLWLCGLDSNQLSSKMCAFGERNSWGAFILPSVLGMIILAVMWNYFLMPAGQLGLVKSLNGAVPPNPSTVYVPAMMQEIAGATSVIMTTFLGAYFYILSVLIRRWQQADMTTGVLWSINVRLTVAIVVGFLLTTAASGVTGTSPLQSTQDPQVLPLMIGFLAGIVPDTVLRWLTQQAKRVISPNSTKNGGLFRPSDLQEKIDGLNFWQADRLFEEGIENIQDLAMKEIPDLLIDTRFDTPHVLYWVDQALLSNQVGELGYLFHDAFIKTASDLANLAGENKKGLKHLLAAIQDGQGNHPSGPTDGESKNGTYTMTLALLENIVEGLRNGPNLPYAQSYWENTSSPDRRAKRLAQLDQVEK